MPLILIAAAYAGLYWMLTDLSHNGAESFTLRAFVGLGKSVWYVCLPFVWLSLIATKVTLSRLP